MTGLVIEWCNETARGIINANRQNYLALIRDIEFWDVAGRRYLVVNEEVNFDVDKTPNGNRRAANIVPVFRPEEEIDLDNYWEHATVFSVKRDAGFLRRDGGDDLRFDTREADSLNVADEYLAEAIEAIQPGTKVRCRIRPPNPGEKCWGAYDLTIL